MAILKPGILGTVSGRLGSVEFAVTRAGCVVKGAKTRRPRVTEFSRAYQTRAPIGAALWRGFSDDVRRQWRVAAQRTPRLDRLGQARFLSGYQLFLSYIDYLDVTVPPDLTIPPWAGTTPSPTSLSVDFSDSGGYLVETTGAYPKGMDAFENVSISRHVPAGQSCCTHQWTRIGTFDHDDGPLDRTLAITWRVGTLGVGERVGVSVSWWWLGYWWSDPLWVFTTVGA